MLRNEDLDRDRAKPEFVAAFIEDLRWLGLTWDEGPDVGGPYGPYSQSERIESYRVTFDQLRESSRLYPCTCSRKDIQAALTAPHPVDDEPIYPGTCRPKLPESATQPSKTNRPQNWRFQVPDGEVIDFVDKRLGPQRFVAGRDFGDFVVWRHDDLPSYQLACVADDALMRISEVVRGADLLISTARQLLLYRALQLASPAFYHCPLMTDDHGVRLAKRHSGLSLAALREAGRDPAELRARWQDDRNRSSTLIDANKEPQATRVGLG